MIAPAFTSALADRLSATPAGTFEAHLTVETDGAEQRDAFATLCARLGVKCVLIELADGVHRAQPMTASHHRGTAVVREVEALYAELWRSGFPVIRVKLEALTLDHGAPLDDAAAQAAPESYFEFHAKVRLDPDNATALDVLAALCVRRGAHLSRNDRKRDRGATERFITLRAYGMGRARAEAAFDALLGELAEVGHPAIKTKREYTIYDGRVGLDAGWLEPP